MVFLTRVTFALFAALGSIAAPTIDSELARRAPDFELGNLTSLARRQNYQEDYSTGGDVVYTHTTNSYTVKFDAADDFVVGVGWNPGSAQ